MATRKKNPTPPTHRVVFYCRKTEEVPNETIEVYTHATIQRGKTVLDSIRCPACNLRMVASVNEMSLKAHGKSPASLQHELRMIKQL